MCTSLLQPLSQTLYKSQTEVEIRCSQKQKHGRHISKKHYLTIDMTCEDCDELSCLQCAKTDHKDRDWKAILTVGSLRRRELKKNMCKIKEEDVKEIDGKIK